MTVAEALALARTHGLPRSDANVLLGALLGRSRTWLLTHDDAPLDAAQQARWQDWLARRADGVPVAYLTGQHEFHGLLLHVTPDVLDPRPDTETLVDWALALLATRPPGAAVVDLGTGSGAIALAIRHRQPDAVVSAVDLSPAALAVAQANGERLGLPVRWRLGAWFAPVASERFDLVVSNPPYIAEGDTHLPALRHEPTLALTSGTTLPTGPSEVRRIWIAPNWVCSIMVFSSPSTPPGNIWNLMRPLVAASAFLPMFSTATTVE